MSAAIAIGIGCRKGCAAELVEAIVRQALSAIPKGEYAALFTIVDKREEVGIIEGARRLGLPLKFLPRESLRAQAASVRTHSSAAEAVFGVPSVAEAAALAGAGPNAVLLVTRIANQGATCAVAAAREQPA